MTAMAKDTTSIRFPEELVEKLGLQLSRYEGPTGIVGVLHDTCRRSSLPAVSLSVPLQVDARAAANWDDAH